MSTSAIVKSYTDARKDLDRIAAQRKLIYAKNRSAYDNATPVSPRSTAHTFTTASPFYPKEQYVAQVRVMIACITRADCLIDTSLFRLLQDLYAIF